MAIALSLVHVAEIYFFMEIGARTMARILRPRKKKVQVVTKKVKAKKKAVVKKVVKKKKKK